MTAIRNDTEIMIYNRMARTRKQNRNKTTLWAF